jgi:hypothetical protein
MEHRIKSKTLASVAAILDRELEATIKEWNRQVNLVPGLADIPLSVEERAGHLPKLFDDLLIRLLVTREAEPPVSLAAGEHGRLRFAQGYSAAMLIEESRIFEVAAFGTLHLHQDELDRSQVLSDVLIIADEADRQLTETVRSFMAAQAFVTSTTPL